MYKYWLYLNLLFNFYYECNACHNSGIMANNNRKKHAVCLKQHQGRRVLLFVCLFHAREQFFLWVMFGEEEKVEMNRRKHLLTLIFIVSVLGPQDSIETLCYTRHWIASLPVIHPKIIASAHLWAIIYDKWALKCIEV